MQSTIQSQQKQENYELVFSVFAFLLLVSLLYSSFALSIFMFSFGFLALFAVQVWPLRLQWRGTFPRGLVQFLQKPVWWVMTIPFWIVLFGAFHSDDSTYWLTRVRIKVPFLLLPMAFFLLPSISRKCYLRIHWLLVLVMAFSALPIVWQMTVEYQQLLLRLQQGQPIPTPGNHIRYSLLICMASLSCFLLWQHRFFPRESWRGWLLLCLGIALAIFLHFLAVRSGIAALYICALLLLIRRAIKTDRKGRIFAISAAFILVPIVAYQTVPSFQTRLEYMVEDLSKYQDQRWNAYSDAERLLSVRAGIDIARSATLFGVGPGDLKTEMKRYFYRNFDKDTFKLPHNQYITLAAGSGLVGLFSFLLAMLLPLLIRRNYRNDFLLLLFTLILLSMLVENTFEVAVGVAIFIFFGLTGLNYQKRHPSWNQRSDTQITRERNHMPINSP